MKKFFTILLSLMMATVLFASECFAVNISGVDTDELPDIKVKITAAPGTYDKINTSAIKATLDDEELVVGDFTKENSSVEWIIMIDTSISVSPEHFTAQKNAVLSVYKTLRDTDTLVLYTFAEKVTQKLYGNETYQQAKKKVDAIECNGQDTAFYAAATKLASLAKASTSAVCVPVIFSDGVETLNKENKSKTAKALKESPVPIYGFYPDVVDDATQKAFTAMIKNSGGSTKSFSKKNASSQLASFNSDDTYSMTLTVTNGIKPSQNAELFIDINGDTVKKEIVIGEWKGDSEAPDVKSAVSDDKRNTITVMYSELITNCKDESIYKFTAVDGEVPKITGITRSADDSVIISVDQLEASGVKLTISGYKDAAGNVGKPEEYSITINENIVKTLKSLAIGAVAAILIALIIISIIVKANRKKKASNEVLIKAAYKNGKKIEQKKDKTVKEAPKKEKLTPEEKAEQERLEKLKKKEEEKRKAEEAKFKFYFEDKYDDNDDHDN